MSKLNIDGWTCPIPLRNHPQIVMGHGGGGKLSAELIQHLFLPAFANAALNDLGDSAQLAMGGLRLAFSTDSFVVRPLFFPGGNIGDLAINGTVNDIAMSGAQPLFLSTGFIVEEGMALEQLARIANTMGAAASAAGVALVTGDTKVVDKGHGDGLYINTSGIGIIPEGVQIAPHRARPGDVVMVSGEIGVHGIAIMSVREGLAFGVTLESDSAPLNGLVNALLAVTTDIHVLRDPTRGGVASSLNEIAKMSHVGIAYDERKLPVPDVVRAACDMLGMDPIYVANEGKLIAIVPAGVAEEVWATMQQHPLGRAAQIIGQVTEQHPGVVVARTGIGGSRVVDMQVGEQLPRIC
ncbi:MAG TPA: hydrogenase expression/formation protein HypE [Caldilineaceae bacterium]|nr:hydrogenase expression/formation protein HypE [Caldilineaceae bacterium]